MTMEKQRAAAQSEALRVDSENDHKMVYSNSAAREVERLSGQIALENAGFTTENTRPGVVLINGKWEVALRSWKWRKIGRPTWYPVKDAVSLYQKLVLNK